MRCLYILIFITLLTGCGGRQISQRHAENLITERLRDSVNKDDIAIVSLHQTTGSTAIVETKLKTVFRLEKEGSEWKVRDIRFSDGRWESISDIELALETVKIEETKKMLDLISAAILSFMSEKGKMPDFSDYVSLSDQLSPRFLTPLIRLDAWGRPFYADRKDSDTIIVRSAGTDGIYGTESDIQRVIRR
ncbi:MAG TPA: hypothetical protein VLL97_00285 [Acidobacteriota bacterium]|nr:hypothetical protein [Acidobacteriota bacterium]